ncbi:MAG: cytochrome c3 family protein [Thaumarchaeota archaeon]|nr:cytochrome c3 family protein [Nitrososphaerota archaeon]
MFRRKYVLILLALLSVSAVIPALPSALPQQNEAPKGLTGAHAALQCSSCHGEGVWHTTNINATICKSCHSAVWSTVTGSKHSNLFFEGQLQMTSGTVRVKYCVTCHNAHQPDSLSLRYTNGTSVRIAYSDYKSLCLKCHGL